MHVLHGASWLVSNVGRDVRRDADCSRAQGKLLATTNTAARDALSSAPGLGPPILPTSTYRYILQVNNNVRITHANIRMVGRSMPVFNLKAQDPSSGRQIPSIWPAPAHVMVFLSQKSITKNPGTAGAGGMAPSISTRISARLTRVQARVHSSPVNVWAPLTQNT